MPADDPLTPEELEMRRCLESPRELALLAAEARRAWEKTPAGRAAIERYRKTMGGFRAEPRKEGT